MIPNRRGFIEVSCVRSNGAGGWAGTTQKRALCALLAFACLVAVACGQRADGARDEHGDEAHADGTAAVEVDLSPEQRRAANLEIVAVVERPANRTLDATGTVEATPEGVQHVTPLVGGRVEKVLVQIGDPVRAGQTLAVIASPDVAQLHGKLHEAETRVALAERNHTRVLRAENRAAVVTARARLDEAEANYVQTKKIVDLGVGPRKDLIAAEAAYKTAQAEFDFQSTIALNKEVQEAAAELETARVDASHIRFELLALGVPVSDGDHASHDHDSSLLVLKAAAPGIVTDRFVNTGAAIAAGQPLFTISNHSTVWVIANVPEGQVGRLRVGSVAEVWTSIAGVDPKRGSVAFIDPRLDEATRTARVRVETANPSGALKTGMFVEVRFQVEPPSSASATTRERVVPAIAVQRIGDRSVVFVVDENDPQRFEVRDVDVGPEVEGQCRVLAGLESGEQIVARGSFTLKTHLLKGELGGHDH